MLFFPERKLGILNGKEFSPAEKRISQLRAYHLFFPVIHAVV